jgi:hypothetical protein
MSHEDGIDNSSQWLPMTAMPISGRNGMTITILGSSGLYRSESFGDSVNHFLTIPSVPGKCNQFERNENPSARSVFSL